MPINEKLHPLIEGKSLVAYISDIEGNFAAWQNYITHSAVVYHEDSSASSRHHQIAGAHHTNEFDQKINSTAHSTLTLRDNCHFVFGGDVCDRGNGDIRILQDLIHLKQRYPDRVHFIMGNRDVNKMRLPFALHPKVIATKPKAYWTPNTGDEGYELNDKNHKMKWVS